MSCGGGGEARQPLRQLAARVPAALAGAVLSAGLVVVGPAGVHVGSLAPRARSAIRATPAIELPPHAGAWQYQLQVASGSFVSTGGIDTAVCAPAVGAPAGAPCRRPGLYDIDLDGPSGTSPIVAGVRAVRRAGAYPVCYVDAGTWERWRPDAGRFPRRLLGRPNGWPGERWLDVRSVTPLLAIMATRVEKCRRAGFAAVEFDNVDGYDNATGFPITAADQLRYDRDLATLADRAGLAAGLKNDYGQVAELAPSFDFAIDESCAQYGQCGDLAPFVKAGKPVFDVEYAAPSARLCAIGRSDHVDMITKHLSLFALPWSTCPSRSGRSPVPPRRS